MHSSIISFDIFLNSFLIVFLLIVSCSSTKNLKRDNSETKTEVVDSGELSIKRPSDTLELTIPKTVHKDTTIYKRGRKSTVYLNYDSYGNAKVISVCDSIAIFKKWYNKTKQEEKKDIKEKDKTIDINPILFVYFFVGLFILIILLKISNKFI